MLNIHGVSPIQDLNLYYLNFKALNDQGPFTCRYRLYRKLDFWSEDSKPVELMWSDGEPHNRAAGQSGLERYRQWLEVSRLGIPKQNSQI